MSLYINYNIFQIVTIGSMTPIKLILYIAVDYTSLIITKALIWYTFDLICLNNFPWVHHCIHIIDHSPKTIFVWEPRNCIRKVPMVSSLICSLRTFMILLSMASSTILQHEDKWLLQRFCNNNNNMNKIGEREHFEAYTSRYFENKTKQNL